MSALHPKADICSALAHVRFGPIADSCTAAKELLFDHLVRAGEQRWRHGEVKGFGGLEIDDQLILGRSLHRQVRRPLAFKSSIDVTSSLPILGDRVGPVADQTAISYEIT